ncbi:hypothetical protein SGRI78S_02348 [Streptomyces griseus subsp. griseus]
MTPGRNATRNFSRSVCWASATVVSQASSHQVPVGVSTASKPNCSAALAIWIRYSMSGARTPLTGVIRSRVMPPSV